jgi:hypothetical protein
MTPRHGDRLSVIDTSFLNLEKGSAHMHVGGITIFDGPPLECGAIYRYTERRERTTPLGASVAPTEGTRAQWTP